MKAFNTYIFLKYDMNIICTYEVTIFSTSTCNTITKPTQNKKRFGTRILPPLPYCSANSDPSIPFQFTTYSFNTPKSLRHSNFCEDVLEWMKDWGNAFNRAASKPSFVEHLQALDKIEPALQSYLATQFSPPLTSSHKSYEKEVKAYIDKIFPGRFESHREFQNATMFRKRMREHNLWQEFLDWCWQHVDFNSAADMESGSIYKVANAITRKFLAFNLDTMNTKDPSVCTWGTLVFWLKLDY